MTTTPAMPELPPITGYIASFQDGALNVAVIEYAKAYALATLQAQAQPAAVSDEDMWQLWLRVCAESDNLSTRVMIANFARALRPQAAQQAEPEFDGCVIVGHSKHRGGWFVYEECSPGEYTPIKGPFANREAADAAMRDPDAPLLQQRPAAQEGDGPIAASLGDIVAVWDQHAPSEYMTAIHMQAKRALAGQQPTSTDMRGWCAYVGGMVAHWVTSEPDAHARLGDERFEAAIAGIIERRLWAMPKPAPQQATPSREARESEQRERMQARLAARPDGKATADFDLPAPNDATQQATPAIEDYPVKDQP